MQISFHVQCVVCFLSINWLKCSAHPHKLVDDIWGGGNPVEGAFTRHLEQGVSSLPNQSFRFQSETSNTPFRCQQLINDFTFTTFSLSGAMCFTNWQGDAQILLRRIEGKPCHALIPHYTFEGKLDGSNYFFVILHELEDSRLMIMMSASQQRIQLRAIEVHVSSINICLPSNLVLKGKGKYKF